MRFFKNKLTVTIIVLSVTFLILIGYSAKRDKVSFAESSVGGALNTVQGGLYNSGSGVKDFLGFILNFNVIREENNNLKARNNELESKALEYDALKNENERLREMLNFKNQNSQYNYIGCDIIGKSGGNFLDEFTINKGKNDGIERQMVVVTSQGLVGQVTSVGNSWAIVQTLSNENIAVSGIVQSTRESVGIIKGYRDSDNTQLAKIYYLPLDSKIKEDDVILTSGLGGLYPKGIRIGYVIGVEEDKGKVMKNAIIKPYINLNKLEEVFVVVPKNKIDKTY